VFGQAREAISGLALTNENYILAVNILKERYGNVQEIVKTHYDKIMKLQPATSRVTSLRYLLDNVNKHLRSLHVLGQDSELFVSALWSKIPQYVLLQLQLSFGVNNKWSVSKLVDTCMLNENVIARERTEIKSSFESRKTVNLRATIDNDHSVLVAPRESHKELLSTRICCQPRNKEICTSVGAQEKLSLLPTKPLE